MNGYARESGRCSDLFRWSSAWLAQAWSRPWAQMSRSFAVDDPVYAYSYPLYDNGAWAEYMLVPVSYVSRAPASLELSRAGAVPIAGLTAHETVIDMLKVHAGDIVLITNAAGGVGHLALQIAADLGANVVATASPRNHEFVRALGAVSVFDSLSMKVVKMIRARYRQGVNKALNCGFQRVGRPDGACIG